jgi:2-dehydro-3-deoxygalactonokinase
VLISGMASSSIGWCELPYASLPFALDGRDVVWKDIGPLIVNDNSHRVILLSGVRGQWEIMRGEETQVLGFVRLRRDEAIANEMVIILPGTHSKHVHLNAGQIIDFQTYLTGELFDVLSRHSVLRHSVGMLDGESALTARLPEAFRPAFLEGVEAVRSRALLELLFRVRTRQVLHGHTSPENRAFLSGLLIGAEICGLLARYPDPPTMVLCGAEALADLYETACRHRELQDRLRIVPGPEVEQLSAFGQGVVLDRILAVKH